jgi:hypothetical protein
MPCHTHTHTPVWWLFQTSRTCMSFSRLAMTRHDVCIICIHIHTHYRRLYGCMRVACGWIVWHVRQVDDGRFRRTVCEALCCCYVVQAGAVLRAQFTDRHTWPNWVAIVILSVLATLYGSFRFGKGGNLIKIYELPTAGNLA